MKRSGNVVVLEESKQERQRREMTVREVDRFA
jgi:hypothetical protein